MRSSKIRFCALMLVCCGLAAPRILAEDKIQDLATDDGRLDPAWFGAAAPDFRHCEGDRCKLGDDEVKFDYLWIKSGFALNGHTLLIKPWEPTAFRGTAHREAKEVKNGAKITAAAATELVKQLNKALKGAATASLTDGDWIVTARLVDCAGPFGIGFLIGLVYLTKIRPPISAAELVTRVALWGDEVPI